MRIQHLAVAFILVLFLYVFCPGLLEARFEVASVCGTKKQMYDKSTSDKMQLFLFLFLVALVCVFIKLNSYEKRIKQLEDSLTKYVTYEDYMETFHNMFHSESNGDSVQVFDES